MEPFDTGNKSNIINSKGVNYVDFRNTLTPRYLSVWLDIFTGYFALIIVVLSVGYLQKIHPAWFILSIAVGSLLVGYIVQAIHLFMHEAAHYNLAADKRKNDLLANIFVGLLVGFDVEFFRTMHFAHHKFLGTVKDPEKSYFESVTWRLVFESLTGIRGLKVVMHRNKNVKLNSRPDKGTEVIKKNNRIFIVAALLNLLLVITFFVTGYWHVALVWLIGMGAAFPFFASIRNILEHRSEEATAAIDYNKVDQGAALRMFGKGLIGRTMGSAGFNRHLLHHWDPQVSYTRLKDVEDFLVDTQLGPNLRQNTTTYFKTFRVLLNR